MVFGRSLLDGRQEVGLSLAPARAQRSRVARSLLQAGVWAATGRSSQALPSPEEIDDEPSIRQALIERAIEEKMAPMLAHFAEANRVDLGDDLGALAQVSRVLTETLHRQLDPVLDELIRHQIEVVVLKGVDLDLAVYPPEISRFMEDMDLMVRGPDLPMVEETFERLGFRQGRLEKQDLVVKPLAKAEKEALESSHFELLPYFKIVSVPELKPLLPVIEKYLLDFERLIVVDDDVYLAVASDVHHNLATHFDIRHIWKDLRTIDLPGGHSLLGQSFSDMLWFLAVRVYHEVALHNQKAMRQFVDSLAVAHRRASEVDWHRVMEMAEEYKLHPSLFFVFWHINELIGPTVPDWVVESCNPSNVDIDRSHDWGDLMPKMFGEVVLVPVGSS